MTSLLSLAGCRHQEHPNTPDYSWVRPIVFHQETKDWLQHLDWPPSAYGDFDQIAKHNEKCRLILHLPTTSPTTKPSESSTEPGKTE